MRIAVVGASGRSGRAVVAHALAVGHEVVAVVRDPARAPAGATPAVAGVRDPAALGAALTGADAVVSALGHVRGEDDPTLLRDAAAALVEAMTAAGVGRLVIVSAGAPYVAGDDPLSRYLAKPILGRLFHADDTRAMEQVIAAAPLDAVRLRPSRLVPGVASEPYRAGIEQAIRWHYSTRFDTVGRAAVDALERPDWAGHAVFITG